MLGERQSWGHLVVWNGMLLSSALVASIALLVRSIVFISPATNFTELRIFRARDMGVAGISFGEEHFQKNFKKFKNIFKIFCKNFQKNSKIFKKHKKPLKKIGKIGFLAYFTKKT